MQLVDRNNNTINNLLLEDIVKFRLGGPFDIDIMHVAHRIITHILSEIDIDIKVLYDIVYFDDSCTSDYFLLVDYYYRLTGRLPGMGQRCLLSR
jgi:hypothetical protein